MLSLTLRRNLEIEFHYHPFLIKKKLKTISWTRNLLMFLQNKCNATIYRKYLKISLSPSQKISVFFLITNWLFKHFHCVKSVRIGSFSGPYFPAFGLITERYWVMRIRMRDNMEQNNSEYGHFLHIVWMLYKNVKKMYKSS